MTPLGGGEMAKKLDKICKIEAERSGIKIKVIERGGQRLSTVCGSNPTKTPGCKRGDCTICKGEKPGLCSEIGPIYEVQCIQCENEGIKTIYIGESGKNGYLRSLDHKTAIRKLDPKNAMGKHCIVQHESQHIDIKMKIIAVHKTCVMRQNGEAVWITNTDCDMLMNSRIEHHQPPISRIVIQTGNRQETQERYQTDRQQTEDTLGTTRGRGARRGRPRGRGRGLDRQQMTDTVSQTQVIPVVPVRGRPRGRPRGRGRARGRE